VADWRVRSTEHASLFAIFGVYPECLYASAAFPVRDKGNLANKQQHSEDCFFCQGVELLSTSASDATVLHLALGDHVHEFYAGQQDAGTTKILENWFCRDTKSRASEFRRE